jgi:hypothetical protein
MKMEDTMEMIWPDHGDEDNPDNELVACNETNDDISTTSVPAITSKGKGRKSKLTNEFNASTGKTTVKKRRLLKKDEKADIVKAIKEVDVCAIVKQQVCAESINIDGLTQVVDSLVEDTPLFQSLVNHNHETFISLYNQSSTGKEKYLKFQIEWHSQCSIFLLPKECGIEEITSNKSQSMSELRYFWLEFCERYPDFVLCNKAVILLSSCVYNSLLDIIHTQTTKCGAANSTMAQYDDGDDVYIRFGGAAISDMLHLRYKSIRTCSSTVRREVISQEIEILHSINTADKSSNPTYLKYRDRGYMYSPHQNFIQFIKDVDKTAKEVVTEAGLEEHGDQIVKIAHSVIESKTILKEQFKEKLRERLSNNSEVHNEAEENVWKEFVRKLCNIRIEEFLSSTRQKIASQKGYASTKEQNLRDKLLTHRASLKSNITF